MSGLGIQGLGYVRVRHLGFRVCQGQAFRAQGILGLGIQVVGYAIWDVVLVILKTNETHFAIQNFQNNYVNNFEIQNFQTNYGNNFEIHYKILKFKIFKTILKQFWKFQNFQNNYGTFWFPDMYTIQNFLTCPTFFKICLNILDFKIVFIICLKSLIAESNISKFSNILLVSRGRDTRDLTFQKQV